LACHIRTGKNEILYFFKNTPVKIIPNGIDIGTFSTSNKLSKNEFTALYTGKKLNTDKIIISMGRLQDKKGFDILIDSFNLVLDKYHDAKLFIAGPDEGAGDSLNEQIKRLNMQDKVFLTGTVEGEQKIDFLANADVFALPSHNENFGNVYLESLITGTPIVASTNTPWAEVEKYDCGRWVENTPNITANAILDILSKDNALMCKNSKNLAKNYSWHSVSNQFKLLFEQLNNEQ